MNDCVWLLINVCEGGCRCDKYLSINSDEGDEIASKWSEIVNIALSPLRKEFGEKYGF